MVHPSAKRHLSLPGADRSARQAAGHIRRLRLLVLLILWVIMGCSPPPATPSPPPPDSGGSALFPTLPPRLELGGSDQVMTMRLPGKIDSVDLAVHPVSGWPAVVASQHWSLSRDGVSAFARVYNPKVRFVLPK
jgi:hypothetical protein